MGKKSLQIQQLDNKLMAFSSVKNVVVPGAGWIKAIRLTLGMSMKQLGKKLDVTRQNIQQVEKREQDGSITLKSLKEIARALDMQLVYGFVPNDESLQKLIDRKAEELATQIVLRTSETMKLEDQENSKQRIRQAIKERAEAIKSQSPKILWD